MFCEVSCDHEILISSSIKNSLQLFLRHRNLNKFCFNVFILFFTVHINKHECKYVRISQRLVFICSPWPDVKLAALNQETSLKQQSVMSLVWKLEA